MSNSVVQVKLFFSSILRNVPGARIAFKFELSVQIHEYTVEQVNQKHKVIRDTCFFLSGSTKLVEQRNIPVCGLWYIVFSSPSRAACTACTITCIGI